LVFSPEKMRFPSFVSPSSRLVVDAAAEPMKAHKLISY